MLEICKAFGSNRELFLLQILSSISLYTINGRVISLES